MRGSDPGSDILLEGIERWHRIPSRSTLLAPDRGLGALWWSLRALAISPIALVSAIPAAWLALHSAESVLVRANEPLLFVATLVGASLALTGSFGVLAAIAVSRHFTNVGGQLSALRHAARRSPALTGAGLLNAVVLFAIILAVGLEFVTVSPSGFFVHSLIFFVAIRLSLAVPIVVVEQTDPISAFLTSWERTSERTWPLFSVWLTGTLVRILVVYDVVPEVSDSSWAGLGVTTIGTAVVCLAVTRLWLAERETMTS